MADLREKWRKIIERYRLHPREPANERYWCPELETCSREELKEIESEKLRVLVEYMHEYSPFYREKFRRAKLKPSDIRSLEDLPKVPLTTTREMAEDVLAHPPWGTYTPVDEAMWAHRGWMVFATSGSTAVPRPFRYTTHDREQWAWNDARALWAQGARPGDSAFLAFGYGPHVFLWGIHYALNLMSIPVLSGGGMDSKRRAYMIDTFRPTILGATPSYALYLGRTMQELGYDPRQSSVRLIVTGGEPGACIPATKARIEGLWGARLVEFYGCTEASPTAGGYTCREESEQQDHAMNPHLMEDIQIWEVVDPVTYEPLPLGKRGLTVVTNLFSEGSPQIRFLIGDYAVLTEEPCLCGRRQVRAQGGFFGRADDMLKVRGVAIFPSAVEALLRGIPELGDEFQIVVSSEAALDVLTLVVEARPEVTEAAYSRIQAEIKSEISSKLGIKPVVRVVPSRTLPRTEFKAKRVQDTRQL